MKNHKIDWAKLIYDDLLSKLLTDHRKQYVLYPRFLTGVLAGSPRFAKDNSFPPGNLTYSAIGSNLLSEKKKSATDVRLRNVIAPALVVTLTHEPSGMFSFIYPNLYSSFSRTKTVTNPSVSSPVLPSSPRKRPHPSQSSPHPTAKRTKHLRKGGKRMSLRTPPLTLGPSQEAVEEG